MRIIRQNFLGESALQARGDLIVYKRNALTLPSALVTVEYGL